MRLPSVQVLWSMRAPPVPGGPRLWSGLPGLLPAPLQQEHGPAGGPSSLHWAGPLERGGEIQEPQPFSWQHHPLPRGKHGRSRWFLSHETLSSVVRFVSWEILVSPAGHHFSKLHIYEPVPEFFAALEKVWSGHVRTHQWDVRLHNYGMGDSNRTILLSPADIRGQGTFGMKDSEAGGRFLWLSLRPPQPSAMCLGEIWACSTSTVRAVSTRCWRASYEPAFTGGWRPFSSVLTTFLRWTSSHRDTAPSGQSQALHRSTPIMVVSFNQLLEFTEIISDILSKLFYVWYLQCLTMPQKTGLSWECPTGWFMARPSAGRDGRGKLTTNSPHQNINIKVSGYCYCYKLHTSSCIQWTNNLFLLWKT